MRTLVRHRGRIAVYVVLLLGSVVMIAPFVFNLSKSLQTAPQTFAFPFEWIPDPFTWSNYVEAYNKIGTRAFINSALLTVVVVVGQTILGMMAGFAFGTLRFPLRDSLLLLIVGGLMVPFHVIMIPLFMFIFRIGWLDTYWGLIIPIVAYTDVSVFMFRQFFRTVPREIYEAGILDGAGPIRVFRSLYAPLGRADRRRLRDRVVPGRVEPVRLALPGRGRPRPAGGDPPAGHRGRHVQLQLQPAAARDPGGHVAAVDSPGDDGVHDHAAPLRGEHGPIGVDRMSRDGQITDHRMTRDGQLTDHRMTRTRPAPDPVQ